MPPNYHLLWEPETTINLGQSFSGFQVIQAVTKLSPPVGGHRLGKGQVFTIPKRAPAELPGQFYSDLSRGHPKWWFSKAIPSKMALSQVKDL